MCKDIVVYLAGDSTVETYSADVYPRMGWGQVIFDYFDDKIIFENHAVGGRSSKSFINEGRLKNIENKIKNGDYLFIQFCHNDSKTDEERYTEPYTTYKEYLNVYINTAREKGATPILLTGPVRRRFNERGELIPTHGNYPDAMRELAYEKNVNLIDLNNETKNIYKQLGSEGTIKYHMIFDNTVYKNYNQGCFDNTHFCETGARMLAELVVDGIKKCKIEDLLCHIK